jgi:hypothetical protein
MLLLMGLVTAKTLCTTHGKSHSFLLRHILWVNDVKRVRGPHNRRRDPIIHTTMRAHALETHLKSIASQGSRIGRPIYADISHHRTVILFLKSHRICTYFRVDHAGIYLHAIRLRAQGRAAHMYPAPARWFLEFVLTYDTALTSQIVDRSTPGPAPHPDCQSARTWHSFPRDFQLWGTWAKCSKSRRQEQRKREPDNVLKHFDQTTYSL